MTERVWPFLPWDAKNAKDAKDAKDEMLPGAGKGGMVQMAAAGNISLLVSAPIPPVITSPAIYLFRKAV